MHRNDQKKIITPILFIGSILLVTLPALFLATAAGSDTFSASATVANQAPTIAVDLGQAWTGTAAAQTNIYVFFNATDTNGNTDLNSSTAQVIINQSGTTQTSSGCVVDSTPDGNTNRYNCTVPLDYHDPEGTWTINASIEDDAGSFVQNFSTTGTVNPLDAVAVVSASISFSGNPGDNDVAASPNPQQLNNTGNQVYSTINLTGYSFTSGSDVLDVNTVNVNVSNSATGQALANATEVEITDASLTRGAVAVEDLYFHMDIPGGQATGSYSAQSSWILEAIQ